MALVKAKAPALCHESSGDRKLMEILYCIARSSKTKDKERIMSENRDNESFIKVLNFILDPHTITGLSKSKINKSVSIAPTIHFDSLESVLDYLKTNNTGTDEVIANIGGFISARDKDLAEFYKSIFTKSVRLGAGAATVNKVFGKGFVPEFRVMLAYSYFDYEKHVEDKEFTVTLKLDGVRCVAIKNGDTVTLFSRQGKQFEGLVEIEEELLSIDGNFVLDGELLAESTGTSSEQYRLTESSVSSSGEKTGVKFNAFDILSIEDFEASHSTVPYRERREQLNSLVGLKHIVIVPVLYTGTDTEEIISCLKVAEGNKKEGVMVNINSAPYSFKRTKNLLKVKTMKEVDLMIVGFEEGSGRLTGTLGRITVEYKGNEVGVSGFTDAERKFFWENQDDLMGRVVCVQYFEETKNANGGVSLRFPVFKELREEGKEVSYQ
jgi:DNA ligase-1